MRPSRPSIFSRVSAWLLAGEQRMFTVQVIVIFVIITLLNLGYYRQRAIHEITAQHKFQNVVLVHYWDGFAWYAWALAAPVMLLLIRRYPLTIETLGRNLWRFLLGNAGIYFLVTNTRYLLRILPNVWLPDSADLPIDWASYMHTITALLPLDFLTYTGFFAASFAIDYYFKYRQRADEVQRLQLESARLQSELAQAQLATLRGQLQPHFLFNSFNAIAMLVRQHKIESAVETITQLSGLLRMTIDHVDQPELLLAREIDFVEHYLDIERIRFGGKLQTALNVEPETLDCVVPGLLLQPLVENAIKHGISRRVTPGAVELDARRHGARLEIVIVNDGPETVVDAPDIGGGIGLSNTRSRLRHVYGTDFRFELDRRPDGRTAVRLDLPWRTAFRASALPARGEVLFT